MLQTEPILLPSHNFPGEPVGPDERDSLDIDAIIRFVRRRWRLCLIWLFVGLCAGVVYAAVSPASYMAFASVLVEHGTAGSTGTSSSGTDAANSIYVDTQVLILESDEVVGRVVDKDHLTTDAEFGVTTGGLRSLAVNYIRSLFDLGPAVNPEPRRATIVRVKHALTVRRVGVSEVVEIGFTSRTPSRAATIANAIIQSYVDGRRLLERQARAEMESHLLQLLADLRDKAFPVEQSSDALTATPDTGRTASARLRELQEKTDTYRTLYDRALQRTYGDFDTQLSSFDVRVITPAAPPLLPKSRAILVLVFAVVGAISGLGHALFRESTDHRLVTVEDAQRSTGHDRVKGVPRIGHRAWRADDPCPELQPAYVTVSTILHQALGKLVVRLHDGYSHRNGWIIGVAGVTRGTGVSSVAAHLGRIVAESGQKTLLVDANWQKPSAGQILLNESQGRKLARRLAAIELGTEHIDVLVLRATTPTSELNASLSIVSTLELLRADYDCVIVDFHSFEETADLAACKALTDETIVVAEARRTTSDSLCSFLRELSSQTIAAIILNKI